MKPSCSSTAQLVGMTLILLICIQVDLSFGATYNWFPPYAFTTWEFTSQALSNSNGQLTGSTNVGYSNLNIPPEFVDLNGDGLVDLMMSYCDQVDTPTGCHKITYMNTGCGFIDQSSFTGYCSQILESPSFRHLRKLALAEKDQELLSLIEKVLGNNTRAFLEPIFAQEMVSMETFGLLEIDDLKSMGIPIGMSRSLLLMIKNSSHSS